LSQHAGQAGYQATEKAGKALNVGNTVQQFHAHVARDDRISRYAEFKKPDSAIRIMVATTSLGMGVNMKDINRVVVWTLPITKQVGDVFQQFSRAGRQKGQQS